MPSQARTEARTKAKKEEKPIIAASPVMRFDLHAQNDSSNCEAMSN
jgi:hypothetical protein